MGRRRHCAPAAPEKSSAPPRPRRCRPASGRALTSSHTPSRGFGKRMKFRIVICINYCNCCLFRLMADSLRLPRHSHRPERSREHPEPCPTAQTGRLERFPASRRESDAEACEADPEFQRLRRGNRDRDRASRRALPPADHAAGKADPDQMSEAAPARRGRNAARSGPDLSRSGRTPPGPGRPEERNPVRASARRRAIGRLVRPRKAPAGPRGPAGRKAPPGPCGRKPLRRCLSGRRRSSAAPSCSPRCPRCRDSAAYRSACAHRRCSSHSRRAEGCR